MAKKQQKTPAGFEAALVDHVAPSAPASREIVKVPVGKKVCALVSRVSVAPAKKGTPGLNVTVWGDVADKWSVTWQCWVADNRAGLDSVADALERRAQAIPEAVGLQGITDDQVTTLADAALKALRGKAVQCGERLVKFAQIPASERFRAHFATEKAPEGWEGSSEIERLLGA